jgi:hypothetical protein
VRVRRLVLAGLLACLSVVGVMGPAAARPPARGCPPAFAGPLTFAEIIDAFPPPPGFPDPEGALASFDSNGDGTLCVRALPPGTDINVIDNVANVP